VANPKTRRVKVGRRGKQSPHRTDSNYQPAPQPPLYVKVARVLKDEIVSGIHPVGSLLPTEDKLCERFSVSRYTIREALRLLREDNLVSSRRGAGTIVIPPQVYGPDIHQATSINDLAEFGSSTRLTIESVKMIHIDAKLASRLGLPTGEEWLQVTGYRYSDDSEWPVSRIEHYINRAFAAVGRILQRHQGPIFTLIEDMYGQSITEVHQQISAALISTQLSKGLGVKAGSPALEIRRTYKMGNDVIAQVTINTHPASRFTHSMTMTRVKVS